MIEESGKTTFSFFEDTQAVFLEKTYANMSKNKTEKELTEAYLDIEKKSLLHF